MGERPAASQLNVQYVIDPSGEKTAVILPLSEFEELMRILRTWRPSPSAVTSPPLRTRISSLS
jgi:hypothetical protein